MATLSAAPQGPVQLNPELPARTCSVSTLAIGYCLVEIAIWSPKSLQLWPSLVAAAWIIGSTALSGCTADQLGLGRRGFRESAWIAFAALSVALTMILAGWLMGSLHLLAGTLPQLTHALAYTVWAFQQEFILQCFLFLSLAPALGTRRAILVAALLFSLAHLPNPILVAATFLSGLALTAGFARYRNLYVIALAHAILGLAVAVSIPADLHRNMRVGLGYFQYKSQAASHAPTSSSSATP